jgi:hypothetical protein
MLSSSRSQVREKQVFIAIQAVKFAGRSSARLPSPQNI